MSQPPVCILKTDGVNCDMEMSYAFEANGAAPEVVHINQLRHGERRLSSYAILALSGGFSYGDDIASGKVLANELMSYLRPQIIEFIDNDRPVLGVCNGFQVLVRTGLLPYRAEEDQAVTLVTNDVGRFGCRWSNLRIEPSVCRYAVPDEFESSLR